MVAENLQLQHFSQGEGNTRHIVVTKSQTVTGNVHQDGADNNMLKDSLFIGEPDAISQVADYVAKTEQNTKVTMKLTNNTLVCNTYEALLNIKENENKDPPAVKHSQKDAKSSAGSHDSKGGDIKICSTCNREVPVQNFELHSLQCAKRQQKVAENVNVGASKMTKKKQKKSKPVRATTSLEKTDANDFEALIAEASTLNSKCNFPKCKTNVLTLGMNCEFCSQRFCLSHHIPEVHGCGDMARDEARRRISREGVLVRGSGKRDMKPDPTKRAHMQRKLDKKVTEMSEQRKRKQKEGEKSGRS